MCTQLSCRHWAGVQGFVKVCLAVFKALDWWTGLCKRQPSCPQCSGLVYRASWTCAQLPSRHWASVQGFMNMSPVVLKAPGWCTGLCECASSRNWAGVLLLWLCARAWCPQDTGLVCKGCDDMRLVSPIGTERVYSTVSGLEYQHATVWKSSSTRTNINYCVLTDLLFWSSHLWEQGKRALEKWQTIQQIGNLRTLWLCAWCPP